MSNTPENAPATAPAPENEKEEVILLSENGINYHEFQFEEGLAEGLKFACPQGESVEALIDKYGNETILDMLNSMISLNLRTKIKNGFLKGDKDNPETIAYYDNKRNQNDGVVFTLEEAQKWIPGQRELSLAGAVKLMTQFTKKAQAESDPQKKAEFLAKAKEMKKKIAILVDKD